MNGLINNGIGFEIKYNSLYKLNVSFNIKPPCHEIQTNLTELDREILYSLALRIFLAAGRRKTITVMLFQLGARLS